jgi:hypothetical protein
VLHKTLVYILLRHLIPEGTHKAVHVYNNTSLFSVRLGFLFPGSKTNRELYLGLDGIFLNIFECRKHEL